MAPAQIAKKFSRFFVASHAALSQKRWPVSFPAENIRNFPEQFMHLDLIKAAVLGIVEGLTEYLPVSSTGHLLLMEHFFGWGDDAFGKSFAILIQLGAILALLTIYFGRLWALATSMFTQWAAARFIIGVLIAFMPAAVIGALFGSYVKSHFFDVRIVCIMFIV